MPGNKPRPASMREQLAVVPVRNGACEAAAMGAEVRIRMRLRIPRWIAPLIRLARLPTQRTYVLVGIGREAWDAIDGKQTLADVIEAFAERHRLSFHESRALLLTYLSTLAARGLVVMVGYVEPAPSDNLVV